MAGVSYRCATFSVGGATVGDVLSASASLSADMIYNIADCRKYPQQAASTNHRANMSVVTLDLSEGAQASASAPLAGSDVGAVVLTISGTSSGTMVYTINPGVCLSASVSTNPQSGLAQLSMEFEAAGTGGAEPVVTWASGS